MTKPNVVARHLIGVMGATLILVTVVVIPIAMVDGHVGWAVVSLIPGILGAQFIRFARNTSRTVAENQSRELPNEEL